MLAIAREKARSFAHQPTLLLGDAIAPSFPGRSFDVVMCRHLVWTLPEPVTALRNWRKLLRPAARLLLIDNVQPPEGEDDDEDEDHPGTEFYTDEVVSQLPVMHMTRIDEIVRMVQDAGFTDVREIDLSDGVSRRRPARVVAPPLRAGGSRYRLDRASFIRSRYSPFAATNAHRSAVRQE